MSDLMTISIHFAKVRKKNEMERIIMRGKRIGKKQKDKEKIAEYIIY